MDLWKIFQAACDITGHCVSQVAQTTGQVIEGVGGGTAEIIRVAAETSGNAMETLIRSGLDLTNGAANFGREVGRDLGIQVVSDLAMDIGVGSAEMIAGASRMVCSVPIQAATGTANIISFSTITSSSIVEAIGRALRGGLDIAARPEEFTREAIRAWLNMAYGVMLEQSRRIPLLDALPSTTVILLLLLCMILFSYFTTIAAILAVVVVSIIIASVNSCRLLSHTQRWVPGSLPGAVSIKGDL
ncbi:hypothetical protein BDW75DRAFT_246374 [Aspergillus navahoensis]